MTHDLSLCSNKTQMKHFQDQPKIGDVLKYDPPCQVIKMLRYGIYEKDEPKSSITGMKTTMAIQNSELFDVYKQYFSSKTYVL